MIGIDYNISRIDGISVQFEDDATVSFSLSGKLRSRSTNPGQDLAGQSQSHEAHQRETVLAEVSELLSKYRSLCMES
jgi:hypothetical protein